MELAKLFSRFFWFFGGILLILGLIFAAERAVFLGSSQTARGTVVDVRTEQNAVPFLDDGTGYHYYPTVEFFPQGSSPVRFESPAGLTGVVYLVGEEVPVRFRPGRPEGAVIDSFLGIFGRSLVLGGSGLLFILFGFVATKGFDRKKY